MTDRPASPSWSMASGSSVDQPINFKGMEPPDNIRMTDRPASPSWSMASGSSVDQPINFKGMEPPDNISFRSFDSMDQPAHFKEKEPLDIISLRSNESMDQPAHFKEKKPLDTISFRSYNSMDQPANLKEKGPLDNISFRSCESMDQPNHFKKDNISQRGHRTEHPSNIKRTKSVEFPSKKGHRSGSPSRQSIRSTRSDTLSQRPPSAAFSYFSWSSQEPRQSPHAKDVVCDLCEETKQKAFKSCMTCLASFCEIHIKDHYTIEAMKRHTLVEVTKNLKILQDNARLKKTIEKEHTENQELKNKITMLEQKITELKLPNFICKGKALTPANVVLDPETAHCALLISNDGKCVQLGDKTTVHQSPQRFDKSKCVLGKEGFSSGRHYWEVEVNRVFIIGVARESAQRKGKLNFCPSEGYWCLYRFRQAFTALEDSDKHLQADTVPRVLGVCIDVDEKWVTFYNTETKAHIHTFRNMAFSDGEKIYPMFNIVEKSANLVIKTVSDD